MLLQLTSIGLVAAATVILFSIAAFSFLGTGVETQMGSSNDHNPSSYAGADAVAGPSETMRPSFDAAAPTASTPQSEVAPGAVTAQPEISGVRETSAEPLARIGAADTPAIDRIEHSQPAVRDQADLFSSNGEAAQGPQNGYGSGYRPDSHAAFRYRVKKECGPILNDPVLYRHCVSTFGIHYR
jgi:hypothetical protein